MALFTDEELSRILSAHANGELRQNGMGFLEQEKCCINQAAVGARSFYAWNTDTLRDFQMNEAARWFDVEYNPGWPLGRFLRELEARGLA